MNKPSAKTLQKVFANATTARRVLEMTRAELCETPAGAARVAECYHAPKTHDVRLAVLNSLDSGLHGVESVVSSTGEYADYLNAGDTYAPTVIYWRGRYRAQSIGDFVETMERQGVRFI